MAAASGFDADELDAGVVEEGVEDADGVGASADAGDDGGGKLGFGFQNLLTRLFADDAVEVAHHRRIRMRAENAAEQVVGGANVGDPVAHGLVDGVFEGARAGVDAADFGSEQLHAEDVELLAAHVFGTHVDDAFESEESADGGGGDAVLAGSGFGDDAVLAHAAREKGLSDAVVDLVGSSVEQVFAFQIDTRAAELLREALGEEEGSGASGVFVEEALEFGMEGFVFARGGIGGFEFLQRGHKGFGDVASTVGAEAAFAFGSDDGMHSWLFVDASSFIFVEEQWRVLS